MKSVYSDISVSTGTHVGGICTILITPREWLATDPVVDFDTGRVIEPVQLISNRFWMKLELVPVDFYFDQNEKSNKSGSYYEIIAGGILNLYNYGLQQVLENLRYREFVVIISDRNKRRRIIGDTLKGMLIRKLHKIENKPAGRESLKIDLAFESEDPAPFYNPDNTPEVLDNFIVGIDGNIITPEGSFLISIDGIFLINADGTFLEIN